MGIILQYICGEHECTKCRHQWIRCFYKFKKNNVFFFPFNENHAECLYRWKIKLLYSTCTSKCLGCTSSKFTTSIENRHVITNACNWTIIVYEILHRIAKITNCLTGIYLCKQQFPFTNTSID